MTSLILGLLACAAPHVAPAKANSIYDFSMANIDDHKVKLGHYKGKVLLVVNVASKCGYTPQYAGLEALYKDYKSKGFVILGFPANNFGSQEPGTNTEIKQFCTGKYNVTFPMFSKISVKGEDEDPLYKWLIASSDRPNDDIEWNFCKFLIGKDGRVIARYKSAVTPDSPELKSAIDAALKS
jgi:glutathione peroxidase